MKKIVLSLLAALAVGCATSNSQNITPHERAILDFYTQICSEIARGINDPVVVNIDSLRNEYIAPALAKKLCEHTELTGADELIRAQDFRKEDVSSITVRHVDGEWYIVGYTDSYSGHRTTIPLRAVFPEGKLQIVDIITTYQQY